MSERPAWSSKTMRNCLAARDVPEFSWQFARTANHTLKAVLYHRCEELVTDWPALFRRQGFTVICCQEP
jgi:hypothetical protein